MSHDSKKRKLAKIQALFISQLSDRLSALKTLIQRLNSESIQDDDLAQLHLLSHNLHGSAGTFGQPAIAESAHRLECLFSTLIKQKEGPQPQQLDSIAQEMGQLETLVEAAIEPQAENVKFFHNLTPRNYSPLVYLVEDDPEQAELLRQTLADSGYRVRGFKSPKVLADLFKRDKELPDALVMDLMFPEGDSAGAEQISQISKEQGLSFPVIALSIRDDLEGRLQAFRAGACRYLTKPLDSSKLIAILDEQTNRQPTDSYRVLLVDDEPLLLEQQAEVLRSVGMEVCTLSEPMELLGTLDRFSPDVVVLDVYMPKVTGPELAAVLRERVTNSQMPILFLSTETDMTRQLLALGLGGDDFLTKPVAPDHLIAAITARARRARQQVQAQNILKENLREAEKASLAKSEFLSNMSHEIRTPMNAIMGFSQILGISGELNPENEDIVRQIYKAGQHLMDLINEVLDLAKIESGRIRLILDAVPVKTIIEECKALLGPQANLRNITINTSSIDDYTIHADRKRFKQVVLNLMSNAVKYNREGGQVYISTEAQDDQRVTLKLEDSGYGIPSDQIDKMFEPFYRLPAHDDIEGTGIGLTLTRNLIEMMGGHMGVKSEVGVGSTFWFEMPLHLLASSKNQDLISEV